MTIILTTHYLEEAEEMCDEIAIINKGTLVTQDKTSSLLAQVDGKSMVIQPQSPIEHAPQHAQITSTLRKDGALVLTYNMSEISADDVLSFVRDNGISIMDVRTEQADLEEVFLSLTKAK